MILVDEATGEERWAVQAHNLTPSTRVAMSPSGWFVASVGGEDDNWMLWDAADGAERMAGARQNRCLHLPGGRVWSPSGALCGTSTAARR